MTDVDFTVEMQPRIATFGVDTAASAGDILHNQLPGRSASDAHPQTAITGLVPLLSAIQTALDVLDGRLDVFDALGSLATDAELATSLAVILGGVTVDADTLAELKALTDLRAKTDASNIIASTWRTALGVVPTVLLTQAAYNALSPPAAGTVYVISG